MICGVFVGNRGKGERGVDFAETRAIALDGESLDESAARGGRRSDSMEDFSEENGVLDVPRFERDLEVKKVDERHGDQ